MRYPKEKIIVVTGAAGFIGSAVIRTLNQKGHHAILGVDDLGHSEKWKNLVGKQLLDLISKHALNEWLKEHGTAVSGIIHLGACSSTVEKDATYLLENNYRYSVRLAEHAFKHNIRFIYASSAATYGDGTLGFADREGDLEKLQPLNMYGFSKHLFDLWLKQHQLLDRVVGLKYFNVFGPNEYHKGRMASAITHILPTARKEGVIRLFQSNDPSFADGEQKRDFIYVKDAARMTCAFLDNQATGIYNIGSGRAGSWNEVAHGVFRALDRKAQIDYIPMPADLQGKYQNYTCADMEKTMQVLGAAAWCAPLEESVVEYVRNYLLPEKTW